MTPNQNANSPTARKEIPEILRGKRYLDPSYDPAFYALLDDEEALADFINSLLHLEDGRKIKSMKYTFNQPLILRAPEAKEIKFDTFLSNSFGFGGTNSTLLIKDFK